ncbi:MAG: hypothetical protein AB7S38_43560 [Vulcanimicrobiota bacterium]
MNEAISLLKKGAIPGGNDYGAIVEGYYKGNKINFRFGTNSDPGVGGQQFGDTLLLSKDASVEEVALFIMHETLHYAFEFDQDASWIPERYKGANTTAGAKGHVFIYREQARVFGQFQANQLLNRTNWHWQGEFDYQMQRIDLINDGPDPGYRRFFRLLKDQLGPPKNWQ